MRSSHRCSYGVGSCHGVSGVAITNVDFRQQWRDSRPLAFCMWHAEPLMTARLKLLLPLACYPYHSTNPVP